MGTVRALDAGTLSLSRLTRILQGADLTTLTDPIAKAEQLAKMEAERVAAKPAHPIRRRRRPNGD